ncbi:MAG TPA: hypothetical protein VGN07_20525 [Steroidobacteraceae bacterium]
MIRADQVLAQVWVPALLACFALAGCKQDAKTATAATEIAVISSNTTGATHASAESAENALADADIGSTEEEVSGSEEDEDAASANEGAEVAIDPHDLDNAEVIPSETTNLRATAAEQSYREELRTHAEKRKQEKEQLAADAATPTAAQAVVPSAAVAANGVTPALTPNVDGSAAGAATAAASHPKVAPVVGEQEILAEKNAQWAATAEASSTYGEPVGKGRYTASQTTGAPNVPQYLDHVNSWATKGGDSANPEWLQVGFAKSVHATSIRIRQTLGPGAIARIELVDVDGGTHMIWEGTDSTAYPKNSIGWLVRAFDTTPYQVKAARITLQTSRVWGWNEIDAVQIVGKGDAQR